MAAENEQVVPPVEVPEVVPASSTPEVAAPVEGETLVEAAETPAPAAEPVVAPIDESRQKWHGNATLASRAMRKLGKTERIDNLN